MLSHRLVALQHLELKDVGCSAPFEGSFNLQSTEGALAL